jgi:UDP-4-amino-4,6-dideoxy-N-acetyl-beta-L-altrosamine N-acetyltransferase
MDDGLAETVLAWRNHPDVCSQMVHTRTILWADHLKHIAALKSDQTRCYLCIRLREDWIGVVVFYNLDSLVQTPYYGYYLRPDLIGSSLGFLLEFFVAEYGFFHLNLRQIKAETKASNRHALNLHKQFGFVELETNGRDLIESILTLENWMEKRTQLSSLVNRLTD